MKSLQGKGVLFKLLVFLSVGIIAIGPIVFVVLMGWATIEFNTAVIIATIFLCLFLLTSVFILFGFDLNITTEKTDRKINQFFNKIKPYINAAYFVGLFLSFCFIVYFYFQSK